MKLLLSLFITCGIVCSARISHGQENYKPGYVITHGDTIRGEIDYRDWESNPQHIIFRKSGTDQVRFFSPKNADGFSVDNQVYTGSRVTVESGPYKESELPKTPDLQFRTDTVFLRNIITGVKNLYEYFDIKGKTHYIIGDRNYFEALVFKKYLRNENGTYFVKSLQNYRGQLAVYLKECSTIQNELKGVVYTESSLQKLFKAYYTCAGHDMKISGNNTATGVKFGMFSGVSINSVGSFVPNISQGQNNPILLSDFGTSVGFTLGGMVDILIPDKRQRWSLHNELLFARFKYETHINSPSVTYHYGASTLRLNVLGRYRFSGRNPAFFLNAGISLATTIARSPNVADVNSYPPATYSNYFAPSFGVEPGLLIGAGLVSKRFSFELRHEGNQNIETSDASASARVQRFYLLIGYAF